MLKILFHYVACQRIVCVAVHDIEVLPFFCYSMLQSLPALHGQGANGT